VAGSGQLLLAVGGAAQLLAELLPLESAAVERKCQIKATVSIMQVMQIKLEIELRWWRELNLWCCGCCG
jgi:hypothetical protein